MGVLALVAVATRAEEVDRPPVDPQPDFVRPVAPADPEAPSVTFDPLRNMKSRKERKDEARRAEKLSRNEKILERVRETLKDLGNAKITLYMLDSDDISTEKIDPNVLDPKNSAFFGVKIKQSFDIKADDIPLVQDLITRSENYGEMGALCFYPGMGVLWTSGEKRLGVVSCLYCSKVVFCWKDATECVPLSRRGVFEGYKLYFSYFPDPESEAKIKTQRMIWEQEEMKKEVKP